MVPHGLLRIISFFRLAFVHVMIYMNIGVKINFVVPIKIQRGTNENTNNIATSTSVRVTKC